MNVIGICKIINLMKTTIFKCSKYTNNNNNTSNLNIKNRKACRKIY